MELPAYHAPGFRNLMLHLWDKTKHFIKKAFTIIFASTVLIWFLQSFSWNWQFVGEDGMQTSILASIGQLIQPLFTPLGFGSQLNSYGWVFAVAAITGLIAKENVIATFSVLAAMFVAGFEGTEDGVQEAIVMIENNLARAYCVHYVQYDNHSLFCSLRHGKGGTPRRQVRLDNTFLAGNKLHSRRNVLHRAQLVVDAVHLAGSGGCCGNFNNA